MTRVWCGLVAALLPASAFAQYTTAIAVDATYVYQGTPYGLWVRRRDDPAKVVARYVRNLPLADAWAARLKQSDPLAAVLGTTPEGNRAVHETLVVPGSDHDVLAQNLVQALAIDAQGRLWIASGDHGLVRRDRDGRFFHVPPPAVAPVQGMVARADGIWVALSVGASRYEGGVWHGWEGGDQGLGRAFTTGVVVTPKNGLLFSLYGGGVAWYEQGRFRQQTLESARAPSSNFDWLTMAWVDRHGTIWAAVERGEPEGLLRYEGKRAALITKGLPADLKVTALAESPRLGILVGTRHGLSRAREGRVEALPRRVGEGLGVTSLAVDGDTLWVGTAEGLVRVKDNRRDLFTEPAPRPLLPDADVEVQCQSVPSHEGGVSDFIRIQRLQGICRATVDEGIWGNEYPAEPWQLDCGLFTALLRKLEPERWAELDQRPTYPELDYSWVELLYRSKAGEWQREAGGSGVDDFRLPVVHDLCREMERLVRATMPKRQQEGGENSAGPAE